MARAPALFFRLELADAIVYKIITAFVDFNFTFLFIIDKKKSKIKINKSCCNFVDNGVSEF